MPGRTDELITRETVSLFGFGDRLSRMYTS